MDYNHYKAEDFVQDGNFRKWVLDPDSELTSFWREWLEANPQKARTVARAIELLKSIPEELEGTMDEQQQLSDISQAIERGIDAWEATKQRTEKAKNTASVYLSSKDHHLPKRGRSLRTVLSGSFMVRIAASIVFILGMFYIIYQDGQTEKIPTEITYRQIEKVAPPGKKLDVRLNDGTEVMLNAGSIIHYTEPFSPDQRIVTLEGEACFKIAQDSLRPFRVKSDLLITTALGTSFNIAAYPQDDGVQVSLSSGKVEVQYRPTAKEKRPGLFYLVPGEQIGYDKATGTISKSIFDADKVLAWKKGIIYLDNVNEATAMRILERWYGIQIEIKGKSKAPWELTARFDNQSLNSVLTSLSYAFGFNFEIDHNHVLIMYT